jgi:uncharacterized membrane protein
MSWNPNPGQEQDPNSQYGQYGGSNPNQPSQPADPYSGQQSAYGQYGPQSGSNPNQPPQPPDPYSGQQSGYNPQAGQPGNYGQYEPQSGYNPQAGQPAGSQQYAPGGYQQSAYQYQQPYGTGAPPSAGAAASGPTSMGMQPNVAAGLSYVLGWITGLVFFLMEKQNRFVRFHAMQSILFFGGLSILGIVLRIIIGIDIPFLSLVALCINGLVGLVAFVGWLVLLINAFQGKYFKLPVIGDYAEKYSNQGM